MPSLISEKCIDIGNFCNFGPITFQYKSHDFGLTIAESFTVKLLSIKVLRKEIHLVVLDKSELECHHKLSLLLRFLANQGS